jgi:redox-sensitive bicupin YhaK (pirin superfamily)
MAVKKVQQVLAPAPPHMVGNGFRVHNFFPGGYNMDKRRMSPFFLLDYVARMEFSPSETPRGVGAHPHKGFETVTISYHGSVAHEDSAGGKGVIREGDIQWMTAGSGLLHKEYHEQGYSRTGGPFQMVQLWVNLPSKDKLTPPKYQSITHESLGRYPLPAEAGVVEVIAGDFRGVKGPASTFTPIELYTIRLRAGATLPFDLPAGYNTGVLAIEGNTVINGKDQLPVDHFALFANGGETITLSAGEDAVLLLLSGEPINEPIAAYGPFLMNTHEELEEAMSEFSRGKYGRLDD